LNRESHERKKNAKNTGSSRSSGKSVAGRMYAEICSAICRFNKSVTMREVCINIVDRLSEWWTWMGWGLFIGSVALPFSAGLSQMIVVWLAVIILWLLWWTIDAVRRQIRCRTQVFGNPFRIHLIIKNQGQNPPYAGPATDLPAQQDHFLDVRQMVNQT